MPLAPRNPPPHHSSVDLKICAIEKRSWSRKKESISPLNASPRDIATSSLLEKITYRNPTIGYQQIPGRKSDIMPPTKRLNVLVYAGAGSSTFSVRLALHTLRTLLGPAYAVLTVTTAQILDEPWLSTCALLVMPGGADVAYCRALDGAGNQRIKQFVQTGGSYLGFCAGGYYGSARCEFEAGKKNGLEVVGDRELAFFPGICRGLAFEGFKYRSEGGARAVNIEVDETSFAKEYLPVVGKLNVYYNGGGAFVDAQNFKDRGVQVLARYTEELDIDAGQAKAAVVYCKVGDGGVVLTGPHPEFAGENLPANDKSHPEYPSLVRAVTADEEKRASFMRACLVKLGLEVASVTQTVPSLSPLHLSSACPSDIAELLQSWQEDDLLSKDSSNGVEYIKGENDTFCLQSRVQDSPVVSTAISETATRTDDGDDRIPDYDVVVKPLIPHEGDYPSKIQTPHFDHATYFAQLKACTNGASSPGNTTFGTPLLYGEVVTSTNTLLDKNPSLLASLPTGFTATATTQVAGRGRGSNVWVSPPGSLMFSVVIRHPLHVSATAPVVFIQYLAAMAVVEGIKNYRPANDANSKVIYENLPIRLKWPNDIYALHPTTQQYEKIGGVLVNSSYAGGDYTLVVGVGLNLDNAQPTTSINQLVQTAATKIHTARAAKAPASTKSALEPSPLTPASILPSILTCLQSLYTSFTRTGFNTTLQEKYYAMWLHSGQIVTLETEGGAKARIKGISEDWGLLVAEEVASSWGSGGGGVSSVTSGLASLAVRTTGKTFQLQSDSNSFDFFRGLVKRKI
ncbi:Hypothetical protein R9X50_00207100 [Acrodontium crateriforme]|uniref:BPL/LPL catalytic domain-containing protein n=1 Tax=Acrodontium crateriforme TaxID=150365 RepID=A0AAQ3M3J8_9PEZI|nr:Hypothetical protein R9X50_00207100 [Acrodontium crateriforme]